jgi:hypothetical protein
MAARSSFVKDVFDKGTVLTALAPPPKGLTYEFVKTSDTTAAATGKLVPVGVRTSGGIVDSLIEFAKFGGGIVAAPFTGGSSLLGTARESLGEFTPTATQPKYQSRFTAQSAQEALMGFADGDSGFFGSLPSLGDIGKVLQGPLGQNLLNFGENLALNALAPDQNFGGVGVTNMAAAPVIARSAGAVATVGRRFFNKFPNLATAIQGYRNMGKNVTRSKLWSLMKRFGPDFLVTGGILTAAAVSELVIAGPGRRRMNPGNVKALRRAHRRMKSFHHVCQVNDALMHGRRRSTKGKGSSGPYITQVK